MSNNKPTKRPSIAPENSSNFLNSMRETLQQLIGDRGAQEDRAVTWRELQTEGIVEAAKRAGTMPGGGESPGDGGSPLPVSPTPPKGGGLRAVAAFRSILVSWSVPPYSNHSITRVYRATSNNFGKAQEIGSSPGQVYTDTVGTGARRYYWIRFISADGVQGQPAGPVSAKTPDSPEERLNEITNQIRQSDLYSSLRAEVEVENLNKERTVKVGRTVDGQEIVGGFGMAVNGPDAENPGTVDFGILADRLWLAQPGVDYSDEDKRFPFVIDEGKVYIDIAMIKDATIDDAKIDWLGAEKLVVGAGGAQIARALLSQAAITDAYFYNRLESGAVKRDNAGDAIYEKDQDDNLVPQFESLYSPGESGFQIDPQSGSAEFNDIRLRGLLYNGVLDSNGDPVPGSGSRYIDFRTGSDTEGDFVLGDVESGNAISYKEEPSGVGRILRVRGDILKRDYEPGGNIIIENPGQDNNIEGPEDENGYPIRTPIPPTYEKTNRVKAIKVSRFGTVRVIWTYRHTSIEPQYEGDYAWTVRSLWLFKATGQTILISWDEASKTASHDMETMVDDVAAVEPNDIIEIRGGARSDGGLASGANMFLISDYMALGIGFIEDEEIIK